jgi:hypothetical protein
VRVLPMVSYLWNVGQFLPDYMAQYPRRQFSSGLKKIMPVLWIVWGARGGGCLRKLDGSWYCYRLSSWQWLLPWINTNLYRTGFGSACVYFWTCESYSCSPVCQNILRTYENQWFKIIKTLCSTVCKNVTIDCEKLAKNCKCKERHCYWDSVYLTCTEQI